MSYLNKYLKISLWILTSVLYLALFAFITWNYISSNRYVDLEVPDTISANSGNEIKVKVQIKNKNIYDISSNEHYFITYHLIDNNEKMLKYENRRTEIPLIKAGKSGNVELIADAPMEEGLYTVEVDIVKEGEFWFKDKGNKPAAIKLNVGNSKEQRID